MFKYYKLTTTLDIVEINESEFPKSIITTINQLVQCIKEEYLKKQEGKIGIKNLGNEIRYNKQIKKILKEPAGNIQLIKLTENKRSFIKVFIDNCYLIDTKSLVYFILEEEFGKRSQLVDKTFASIKDIQNELLNFFNVFIPRKSIETIYFAEFCGFDGYFIEEFEGYTKMVKLK